MLGLEFRFAVRSLRRAKTYTVFSVLTLGAAIGTSAAIYTILYAVLLRPLPYEDPDRIVMVWLRTQGYPENDTSYPNYVDLRNGNHTLSELAAFDYETYHLAGDGEPERLVGANVSHNFFPMFGVAPELGDYLSADADFTFPDRRVVLSYGLWERRFGRDDSIVGRRIELDGTPFTVVGVMPESFRVPEYHAFWTPLALEEDARTARHIEKARAFGVWLLTIGRLKQGIEPDAARADLEVIMARIEHEHFDSDGGMGIVVNRLHHQLIRDIRGGLLLLGAAVASLWLIACTNLAGVGLARAGAREGEIALRRTLGASRARVAQTLVAEGVVVGAVAVPVAWLIAAGLTAAFVATAADTPVGIPSPEIDLRTFLFAAALSVSSGVLFSLAPALHMSSHELSVQLKRGGGLRSAGGSRQRSRRALVVSEIALALVLLTGSLLLVRSYFALQNVPSGLEVDNLHGMNLTLPDHYDEDATIIALFEDVVERMEAIPGIESAAVASGFMAGVLSSASTFTIEGSALGPNDTEAAFIATASPGYFETVGIPILQGRDFDAGDHENGAPVVIINRTMAEKYWPGVNPVGQRMAYSTADESEPDWRTIVAVVGDVRQLGADRAVLPKTFLPLRQRPTRFIFLLFRSSLDYERLVPAMKEAIWGLDARIPVALVNTVASIFDHRLKTRRHNTFVLALFAAAAVFLAGIGVYGVLAYSVDQRTHEMGVRMAFGARTRDVALLIWKDGATLLLLGLTIGLLGLVPLARLLSSFVFGVGPFDPLTLIASIALLTGCACFACALPALRASHTDPASALRD